MLMSSWSEKDLESKGRPKRTKKWLCTPEVHPIEWPLLMTSQDYVGGWEVWDKGGFLFSKPTGC